MKLSCKATQVVEVPLHVQAKATRGRGCKVVSKVARSIKQCLPCTRVSRSPSVPAGSRPGAKQQSRRSVDAGQSLAALCENKRRVRAQQLLTPESATEQHEELLQVLEEQATAALTETARHHEQQQNVEQQKHEIQLAQARPQHVGQLQAQQQQHSATLVEAAEQHKQHLLLQEQKHSLIIAEARQQLTGLQVNHYQSVSEIQHQHEQLLSEQLNLQAQLKQELAGHVGALAELQVQLADLQDCLQSEKQQSFKVHSCCPVTQCSDQQASTCTSKVLDPWTLYVAGSMPC